MPKRVIGASLTAACLLILLRAAPTSLAYASRFSATHAPHALAWLAFAGILALGGLTLLLRRWPGAVAAGVAVAVPALLWTSGNVVAAATAGSILALTCLLGDLVFLVLVRSHAKWEDLPTVFAAGLAASGVLLLFLGEVGLLHRGGILFCAAVIILLRARRIREVIRGLPDRLRAWIRPAPRWHEAFWLAIVVSILVSSFVTTLGPEVTWDALAYHLPEARDTAERGRVEPLPDGLPQTLFWRNYQTFLSLGYFFEGERVARLLQFAVGVFVLPAGLLLLRRLRVAGGPLVLLGFVAMPMVVLQLHSVWADWPAAFLVTAAAAEIAAAGTAGRLGLAGLLVGAALATKIFAILALPALLLLWWRRRDPAGLRGPVLAVGCSLLVLLPWMGWSQKHAGFWLAPYADSWSALRHGTPTVKPGQGAIFPSLESAPRADRPSPLHFLRLPYDLTFHPNLWEGIPEGYNGFLPLVLLAGALGWGARRFGLFLAVAIAALLPWYLLYAPVVRYLYPAYPLYVVFAAAGIDRITGHFAGRAGALAGFALGVVTLGFPGQFLSLPFDARVALGRISREQALETYLPSYPLWKFVGPKDSVLFDGAWDRYHCPAQRAWRTGWFPVGGWGVDPERWKRGFRDLGITFCARWHEEERHPLPLPSGALQLVSRRGGISLYRVRAEALRDSDSGEVPSAPSKADR